MGTDEGATQPGRLSLNSFDAHGRFQRRALGAVSSDRKKIGRYLGRAKYKMRRTGLPRQENPPSNRRSPLGDIRGKSQGASTRGAFCFLRKDNDAIKCTNLRNFGCCGNDGGMTAGGTASISHKMNEGGPLQPSGGIVSTSSANRRAKGSHKAAHRASRKRRRAKARKS